MRVYRQVVQHALDAQARFQRAGDPRAGGRSAGLSGAWRAAERRLARVILFTCPARTHGADAPLIKHPCGVAAKALDEAGQRYEVKVVGGFKSIPFSRRGKRGEIRELTGQEDVPVVVLDDGATVQGTGAIVAWAAAHPAQPEPAS